MNTKLIIEGQREPGGQKRGQLTDRIKKRSIELLGFEITQTELRLMPYILDVLMNSQKIDPRKINEEERTVLTKWAEMCFVELGFEKFGLFSISVEPSFIEAIFAFCYLGYIDLY